MAKVSKLILLLFLLVTLGAGHAAAQGLMTINDGGVAKPLREISYTFVEGSPFFNDNWLKGEVILADGKKYKDMKLRYDQVSNELAFVYGNAAPMTFVMPVKMFKVYYPGTDSMMSATFIGGLTGSEGTASDDFYQLLSPGKIQLLKYTKKKLLETKAYGSATAVREIRQVNTFYTLPVGSKIPVKLKTDKKSLLALFPDRIKEMEVFMAEGKPDLKSDAGLGAIFNYYNSL